MQQPRSRKRDEDYEAVLRQWREGVRLEDITLSEPLDKLVEAYRTARWLLLFGPLALAGLSLVRGEIRSIPGAFWLPACGLLFFALGAAYLRYRRWQEAKRIARHKISQENGDQARLRRWRRDRLLSTRAYHALRNFHLSKIGLTMYAAYVAFGGSGLILLNVFSVLEGRATPQDTLRIVLIAYPGMLLTCCPIGAPAFLLYWYCRWRLRSWQRLEDNDPEEATSLLYMKTRAEKLPDERDGAVIVPYEDGSCKQFSTS